MEVPFGNYYTALYDTIIVMKLLNRWWLPALIVSLPFERIPSLNLHVGSHSATIRASLVIAVIGLVAYGAEAVRSQKLRLTNPVMWLGLYGVVILASMAVSIDPTRSLLALVATYITLGTAVIVATVLPRYDLRYILRVIIFTALLVGLFGIYQFIGDSFGVSNTYTGLRSIYTKHVFGFPRVQSTGLEPLFFANYLLLPILLLAGFLYTRRIGGRAWPALGILVAVLAFTLSRGGFAAGIAGLIAVGVVLWPQGSVSRGLKVAGTIALGVFVAVGAIYFVASLTAKPGQSKKAVSVYVHQSTRTTTTTTADSDRVLDRRLAAQAFRQRPLLGYGIGSFGAYAKQNAPLVYPPGKNSPTANNEYLEVLAETGILGAITLGGFLITFAGQIVRAYRRADSDHRIWIAILSIAMGAYLIQYYAFSTLYIMSIWTTVGLLLGLTQLTPKNKPSVR